MIYIGVIDWKKFTFFCAEMQTPQISKFVAEKGSDLYKAFDQFIRDNIEWIPQQAYNRETQVLVRVSCRPNDKIPNGFGYIVNSDLYGYRGRGLVTEDPALIMKERFEENLGLHFEIKLIDKTKPYVFGLDLAWRQEAAECVIRYYAVCQIEEAWTYSFAEHGIVSHTDDEIHADTPYGILRKRQVSDPTAAWIDVKELTYGQYLERYNQTDSIIGDIPREIRNR